MVFLSKFVCVFLLIFLIKFRPICSDQSYDKSSCLSESQVSGSNYLCTSQKSSCDTFIVYRAQENFQTLSSIASLFSLNKSQLLQYNNISVPDSIELQIGQEIIIPVTCSCPDRFSEVIFTYNASLLDSLSRIACEVFEGLIKAQSLIEANPEFGGDDRENLNVEVPIRCACPDKLDKSNGVNYFVTYPIFQNDHLDLMARKFGVLEEMIWDANRLGPYSTIFRQTTVLIPLKNAPFMNWNVSSFFDDIAPSSGGQIPVMNIVGGTSSKSINSFIILGGALVAALLLFSAACCICISIRRRNHPESFQPFSARTSRLSDFSPDFLDGMSKLKHSLMHFSLEELRVATEDFSQASVIGKSVYKGRIGSSKLAIEQMNSEEITQNVIDILTKINHLNVVKLEGCCYGPKPYLVFEFEENGSLRDCLSNAKMAKQLTWTNRLQIAFDLAVGLHYIHFCTKPAYVHRNINSKNVLITTDLRAKISGFRLAKPLILIEENKETNWNESVAVGRKGYLAPEYLTCGQASLKIDVFAFGVVLLELLSAKEAISEGKLLKDSIRFLADAGLEGSSTYLDKFKGFMDPALEGNYPIGDAVCLTLLAKACVENNPQHRPTMNDVLKALSRIV